MIRRIQAYDEQKKVPFARISVWPRLVILSVWSCFLRHATSFASIIVLAKISQQQEQRQIWLWCLAKRFARTSRGASSFSRTLAFTFVIDKQQQQQWRRYQLMMRLRKSTKKRRGMDWTPTCWWRKCCNIAFLHREGLRPSWTCDVWLVGVEFATR